MRRVLFQSVLFIFFVIVASSAQALDYEAISKDVSNSVNKQVLNYSSGVEGVYSEKTIEYFKAKLEFDVNQLNHREKVLVWQHKSSVVLFFIVIGIILMGLMLAYVQFKNTKDFIDHGQSTIKISKDGIEISSSIVGLLILFFSLGFFYLYLTEVYPIKEISMWHNLTESNEYS